MRTWTLRLGLSLLAAVSFGMNRLPAQDAPTLPKLIQVVPAVAYEPAHPVQDPSTEKSLAPLISTVAFKVPIDETPAEPDLDFHPAIQGPRFWARSEYLLWWVKDAPLPVPIVTTGNPNVGFPTLNTAGGIGQPLTQILLGNQNLDFGSFSGMRFTLGGWIDSDRTIGMEVSGFMLERRPYNFAAASDATGTPALFFPKFNPSAGLEDAFPIANPLLFLAGNTAMYSTLQLWGAEGNAQLNILRLPGCEFTLLGGFRYADLRETITIDSTTTDLASGSLTTTSDFFGTRNQFYGGQIGGQFVLESHGFSFDFTGKLALGATQQVVDIQGNTTQFGPSPLTPPGLGTSTGGFYAQPSNIGHYTGSSFSVMPSFEMNVSYQITAELRGFIGYTFMYWNQVVRPGDQINHSVNLTQNAVSDPNGVGTLVGPAQPGPLFNRTDFWAHGLNLGLELRF